MHTPQPVRSGWWTDRRVELVRALRADPTDCISVVILEESLTEPDSPAPELAAIIAKSTRPRVVQRVLALLLDGEYAEAVHTLDAIAADLGMNYDTLMEYADQYMKDGYSSAANSRAYYRFPRHYATFWASWTLVTGRPFHAIKASPFRCC